MPARKTGRRSIWIRRRETVRPGALWCRSRKDRRQVFHKTGGARIEVVLDDGGRCRLRRRGRNNSQYSKGAGARGLKIATAKFSRAILIFALKLACPRKVEAHEVRPIWVSRAHIGIQFKLLTNKARHRIRIFGDGAPQFVISEFSALHRHARPTRRTCSTRIVRPSA